MVGLGSLGACLSARVVPGACVGARMVLSFCESALLQGFCFLFRGGMHAFELLHVCTFAVVAVRVRVVRGGVVPVTACAAVSRITGDHVGPRSTSD